MAPLEENNWEKHLKTLPSYKEYIKLDNEDIKDYSDNYCENDLGSKKEEDIKFCNKVSKLLKDLSAKEENKRKGYCHYFRHWFHDQVSKKYYEVKDKNNKHVSGKLFDLISDAVSNNGKLEPCRCYYSDTNEGWKEEKDLHDYFENYNDINCTNSDKPTCEKYVSYVTYIDKLFKSKEEDCCDGDDVYMDFCKPYIICDYKTRPDDLLRKLQKQLKDIEAKTAEVPKGDEVGVTLGEAAESEQKGLESTGDEVAKSAPPEHTQSPPPKPKEALDVEEVSKMEGDEVAGKEEPGPPQDETTATLQDIVTFSTPSIENSGEAVHTAQYFTPEGARNIVPLTNSEASSTLGTTREELDSNFVRKVIMTVAVLGTIFFLFYYNRAFYISFLYQPSRLEPSSRKRKQKKNIFEHNYYEEYENELAMYDSEETFLDSEMDRLYLNYHPDQDSYY